MGKTYKTFAEGYFRSPRGRKQALLHGWRYRAIPPSAWDDISVDRHALLPYTLAKKFHESGLSREEAIRKLRKKFRLSQRQAEAVTYRWTWKFDKDYAREAYESLSAAERFVVRLRYGHDLVRWHLEWLRNGRKFGVDDAWKTDADPL